MKLRDIRSKYSPSKMSPKHSPAKVTLAMIKGKPMTMSVPAIRYHASDDELEELYPSTDDEKRASAGSEKVTPKKGSRKNRKSTFNDVDAPENGLERRSNSMDENLSETPPSDTWKVLTDIKGKIAKTFEGKLLDIKSEKRKSKRDRSRDTSSVSDYEDLCDVTPTEESPSPAPSDKASEKPPEKEKKSTSPIIRKRTRSSKFVGFSFIKTGLKVKKPKEDQEIETAESALNLQGNDDITKTNEPDDQSDVNALNQLQENIKCFLPDKNVNVSSDDGQRTFLQLRNKIYYQLFGLLILLWCCYFVPLPKYFMGCCAGVSISVIIKRIYHSVGKMLTQPDKKTPVPIFNLPIVEEHPVQQTFEGWLNELPYDYKPDNYHVARTNPVFFILEGDLLQVMETRARIPKRSVWNEPKPKPKFTKKRVYCITGANVELLPKGLIRRRRWSKKYPICITFGQDRLKECTLIENSDDEDIQPLDDERMIKEEDETDDDLSLCKDGKDIFEDCRDIDDEPLTKLFIFARTDRQKEEWFRRLKSTAEQLDSKRSSISSSKDLLAGTPSPTSNSDAKVLTPSIILTEINPTMSYDSYMARYVESTAPLTTENTTNSSNSNIDTLWVNALIGRILFDMHKSPDAINAIQDKIQRKLSNIKLPYFMESLVVSELVIGLGAPIIHNSTKPISNENGLWFDLDISYEGSITMTIETKLNLMKLKRTDSLTPNYSEIGVDRLLPVRSPIFDSDVEDSPETSTEDEDSYPITAPSSSKDNTPTQSSGKKFLNMVDKLASNKYFQHATELSYIRRAMEGVSNTEIRLMVNVSTIEGCLSVNLPPPPSDRLWYGFKPVPRINLTAKPAVGERSFNIVYVTKWIETKLLKEFEKLVVLPNMDDLVIPLCPNYPYS